MYDGSSSFSVYQRNDHFDDQRLEAKKRAEQFGQLILCEDARGIGIKLYTVDHFRNH